MDNAVLCMMVVLKLLLRICGSRNIPSIYSANSKAILEWNERYSVYSARGEMKMNDFAAISYVNDPIAQSEKQEVILSAEHISFQYEKNSPLILRDLSVPIEKENG